MRKIKKWRELQLVYMPGVAAALLQVPQGDVEEDNEVEIAETVPLFLPSGLDSESRARDCLHRVAEYERLLRTAQLRDSLTELRHARKVRRTLQVNHYIQVAGQGQGVSTRSRTAMDTVDNRINKYVGRYRIAYQALLRLDPTGDWRETFLELKDSDNRGPGKEPDERGVGDGSYFRSWIWLTNPRAPDTAGGEDDDASEEDVNELLRVEWTTSFARLERWSEEVELLQEEMRRVVAFLEWKAEDWLAKVGARGANITFDVRSGLDAYARKQAAVYRDLAISFVKLWRPTLVSYKLKHSWATEYMVKHEVPLIDTNTPVARARGIFKFRLSDPTHDVTDAPPPAEVASPPSELAPPPSGVTPPPSAGIAIDNLPLLEASYPENSDSEEDSDSEVDLDDDDDPDY